MKNNITLLFLTVSLVLFAQKKQPNVVFILADDLGWSDVTLYGKTKLYEDNYHHGKQHGTYKVWKEDGTLEAHKEYAYGILLKDFLK